MGIHNMFSWRFKKIFIKILLLSGAIPHIYVNKYRQYPKLSKLLLNMSSVKP